MKKGTKVTPVLITTTERSVYYGWIDWDDRKDEVLDIRDRRHIWEYRVSGVDGLKGVYTLALTGPGPQSKVGPAVPESVLRNIHTISVCSPLAVEAFEASTWD